MSLAIPGYGELTIELMDEEPRRPQDDDPEWLIEITINDTK